MSVIAHNGKVVVSGGKTLNFDNLIALANNTTGETDTTLTDAVQSLIDGYGGGEIPFEIKTGSLVLASQEPSMDIDSQDTRLPLMAYFEYVGLPSPLVAYRMLAWIFEGMSADTIASKTKRINGNPSVAVNGTSNAVAFNNGVYKLGKWSTSYFFMPGTYRWVIVYEKQ